MWSVCADFKRAACNLFRLLCAIRRRAGDFAEAFGFEAWLASEGALGVEVFAQDNKMVSPAFHRFFEKKAVQKGRPHTFTYIAESLVLLEGKWIKS